MKIKEENKKKQPAEFAKDKNAFSGDGSAKGDTAAKKPKEKQPGAHQPRDADLTSEHDNSQSVKQDGLKPERSGQPKTSGHNVQKLKNRQNRDSFQDNQNSFQSGTRKTEGRKQSPARKNAGSRGSSKKKTVLREIKKKRTVTMRAAKHRTVFQRNKMPLQRKAAGKQRIPRMITAAGTLTTRADKRADTAGVNIRTGSAQKNLIPGAISRRKTQPLQRMILLRRVQSRSFRAAKS